MRLPFGRKRLLRSHRGAYIYTATLTIDNVLPVTTVSLQAELTVRELIEAVFVQLQTSGQPDPFLLTIEYYGYDYFQGDTSYLGYFVVSIGTNGGQTYTSSANSYWELLVNNVPSDVGMDSRLVKPNDQVRLEWYTPPQGSAAKGIGGRVQMVRTRRSR